MTDMCVAIDIITGLIRNGRLQGIATRAKVQVGENSRAHVDYNKASIHEYWLKNKYLDSGHAPIFVSGGTVVEWPAARSNLEWVEGQSCRTIVIACIYKAGSRNCA